MLEDDLYDEMILPTAREDLEHVKEQQKEKHSVYIGNFTWWTTDQELEDLVAGAGVTDLVDIRIHDNPVNGLSKGYATVTVESMMSIRLMSIKLQDKVVHNRKIVVDEFTLENMQKYENIFNELVLKRNNDMSSISTIPSVITSSLPFPLRLLPPPSRPPPPLHPSQPPVVLVNVSNYSVKPQVVGISRIPMADLLQTVIPNNPQQLVCPPNIISTPRPMVSATAHPCITIPPSPVIQPLPSIATRKMLTKEEFEEIFSLNKAVVERSMERATLDAQEGLFSEAIETLVTAISLIKESRLGSDPQGIALMTPLKELLQGIEEQSIKRKIVRHKSPHSPGRHRSRDELQDEPNRRVYSEERNSPPPKRRSHFERSPQISLSIRRRSPIRREHRKDGRSQERDHGYKFVDHHERNYGKKF